MAGYIKLHRQLLESLQFSNPNYLKIWIWILLKASHKDRTISLKVSKGYAEVKLARGEFVFGRNKAEKELDLDASLIYRTIKKFENEKSITIKSNNQYSIITICKYDDYNNNNEEDEQPMNSGRTTDEQPMNTDNNVKKVNKVKKSGNKLPLSERELVFLNIMIEVTGRKFKTLDDKTRSQFSELVKLKYTREDFKKAAIIALSEMKERNKEGYLTPEFITRSVEFQKYVTMPPKQQNSENSTVLSAPAKLLNVKYTETTDNDIR